MTDLSGGDPLTRKAIDATGDAEAMHRLLRHLIDNRTLQPPIRRYLFNEDDVSMVEQQTLVAIAFKIDQWSRRGDFAPWARQIAANEAKTLIRSRDRRRNYEDAAANSTRGFVERLSSQLATAADVERCMNELPGDLVEPLRLRCDGYGYRDIAATLEIAEGTAKTRVRAARAALAEALAKR